jgi:hypothetical protein
LRLGAAKANDAHQRGEKKLLHIHFLFLVIFNSYFKFRFTTNPTPRQLVGKTRWVFRQPQGLSPEWGDTEGYSYWMWFP